MKPPFDFAKLRAKIAAMRQPDDPVETVPEPRHEVRLREILTAQDKIDLWDDPQNWCRANVDHAADHVWSRRIDRGPCHDRQQPVFSLSDPTTAFEFKLRYG